MSFRLEHRLKLRTTDELLAKTAKKGHVMRPVVAQMGVTLDGFVLGGKAPRTRDCPREDDEAVIWKTASQREAGTS